MAVAERLRRTMMFVPGNNPAMIKDAGIFEADSIMFDLEDAVSLAEKDAARVVALAQARFSAGIVAGSRVSEARIPALREDLAGLMLKGQYVDATLQLTSALGGGYHHG